ncbi:MAG: threonine/serine dehydratase [Gammaproteobacteria bacterium]|nr:threonine/serine dehydratase [Gammaproteobacteria bacterium]
MPVAPPGPDSIRETARRLGDLVVRTPVLRCPAIESALPARVEVHAKLEFLQRTGTFKARGALAVAMGLSEDERAAGLTAVSAGNHAIAVAYAAQAIGSTAKVVMIRSANPWRVQRCRQFGANVVFADDVHDAFRVAEDIRSDEGRIMIHPFEGAGVVLGTATIGLELIEQLGTFDAVLVPIGGGGLCAGIASAVKQLKPSCRVIGIEPEGADSMHRSFRHGSPQSIDRVRTIADSLGAPYAMPYSFDLCRQFVDELVLLSDESLRESMRFLFRELKLAVEPACAASTAALLGPLRTRFEDQRVVLIMCGSNIDWATFARHAALEP